MGHRTSVAERRRGPDHGPKDLKGGHRNRPAVQAVTDSVPEWRAAMTALDGDTYDFNWLARIVERNAVALLTGLLGGLFLALLYLLVATPKYAATTRILIDPRDYAVIELGPTTPAVPPDPATIDSQVEILSSSRIAEVTLASLPDNSRANAGSQSAPGASEREIESFMERLAVKRAGTTGIIDVTYHDPDPMRAAAIANEVTRSYFKVLLDGERQNRTLRTKALAEQAAKEKAAVEELDGNLQRLRAQLGLQAATDPEAPVERQAATLDQRLAAVRAQMEMAADRVKAAESDGPSGPEASALRQRLLGLRAKYETDRAALADGDPRLLEAVKQIEAADQSYRRMQDEALKPLRADLEAARRTVAEVESMVEVQREQREKAKSLAAELGETERQATAAKAVYTAVLARLHEAEAQQNLIVPPFTIVSAAIPPLRPASPDKLLTLVFTTLGGLLLSAAYLAWRQVTQRPIRDPEAVDDAIGAQFAVAMPAAVPPAAGLAELGARSAWQMLEDRVRTLGCSIRDAVTSVLRPNGAATTDGRRSGEPANLLAADNGTGAADCAQAMFAIKNAIMGRARHVQVVTMISPRSGDGKSTLALNLAQYVSKAGLNVLLVDADLRGRTLAASVGPGAVKPAITAANAGIEQSVVRTDYGFSFCDAAGGQPVAMPMERLAEPDFAAFLSRMRQKYDLILIDTPAVLEYVDAQVLMPLSDVAVMIVDWGRTSHSDAVAASAVAGRCGARKLGAVVNRLPRREKNIWFPNVVAVSS